MAKKRVAASRPMAKAARITMRVRYEQPLGYGVMKPIAGGSLDEELVKAWSALGVRSGDVLVLTLEKAKMEEVN